MQPIKLTDNVTLTSTGLILGEVDEPTFFDVGKQLTTVTGATQWAIGDWYNAIRWGDKAAACERVGLEPETARVYSQVAACFEIGNRFPNCSFTTHMQIAKAALPHDTKLSLLKKAGEEKWTVRQTIDEVKATQALLGTGRKAKATAEAPERKAEATAERKAEAPPTQKTETAEAVETALKPEPGDIVIHPFKPKGKSASAIRRAERVNQFLREIAAGNIGLIELVDILRERRPEDPEKAFREFAEAMKPHKRPEALTDFVYRIAMNEHVAIKGRILAAFEECNKKEKSRVGKIAVDMYDLVSRTVMDKASKVPVNFRIEKLEREVANLREQLKLAESKSRQGVNFEALMNGASKRLTTQELKILKQATHPDRNTSGVATEAFQIVMNKLAR